MNENTTAAASVLQERDTASSRRAYRPKFALYKANGKGTGCAVKFELHPAHDATEGSIWATFANQMTIGDRRGPNPTYPRFDWEGAICVKFGFQDLVRMLQVFRGETESIEDGKGLFHRSPKGSTRILLKHIVEPVACYSLEAYRSTGDSSNDSHAHFVFSPAEALGFAAAVESSMGVICFGLPMVVEHDTAAYKRDSGRMRNASAA